MKPFETPCTKLNYAENDHEELPETHPVTMTLLKVISALKFQHPKLFFALFLDCDVSPPMNTNGAVSSSNTAVSLSRIILLNAYIMMIFHALF